MKTDLDRINMFGAIYNTLLCLTYSMFLRIFSEELVVVFNLHITIIPPWGGIQL